MTPFVNNLRSWEEKGEGRAEEWLNNQFVYQVKPMTHALE